MDGSLVGLASRDRNLLHIRQNKMEERTVHLVWEDLTLWRKGRLWDWQKWKVRSWRRRFGMDFLVGPSDLTEGGGRTGRLGAGRTGRLAAGRTLATEGRGRSVARRTGRLVFGGAQTGFFGIFVLKRSNNKDELREQIDM